MKTLRASDVISIASLTVTTLFTAISYPELPARIATHFDVYGRPNDWTDVRVGAWLMPAFGLGTWALLRFSDRLTRDEAKRDAIREAPMGALALTFALLMCAVQFLLLAYALGKPVDMTTSVCALLGLVCIVLGVILPRTKPNPVVGIRTASTLGSPENWARVHKAAGPLFVGAGLVGLASALVGGPFAVLAMVFAMLVPSVGLAVYSYVLRRRGV